MTDHDPHRTAPDADPHALVVAYALDTLDPDQRQSFEAHLETCDDCRQELIQFRETLAEASVLTQTPPPPELRSDLLRTIATVAQTGPASPDATRSVTGDAGTQTAQPPARPESAPAGVVSLHPSRRRRVAEIAVAAAVAIALAFAGWAVGQHQNGQTVQAEQSSQQRLLTAPDARIYHQSMPGGAAVAYVISRSQNAAMAIVSGRPDAGAQHVFQLWTMHSENGRIVPHPDETFTGGQGQGQAIWLTGDVADAVEMAITIEPDGGSPKPTTQPFAVQRL